MNNNYLNFYVNLLGANGRRIPITGAWKPGFFANDTWESNSVEIPADFPDGTARLAVRASRLAVPPGLDTSNQELDTDGDGFSNASEDTQVDFIVNTKRPYARIVEIFDSANAVVYRREWVEGQSTLTIGTGTVKNLDIGAAYEVKITFSEPVSGPVLSVAGLVNCPNPPLPFRQVSECRKIRRIIIMANIIEKIMQKIIRSSGGGGFFVPDFKAANNIAWRAI